MYKSKNHPVEREFRVPHLQTNFILHTRFHIQRVLTKFYERHEIINLPTSTKYFNDVSDFFMVEDCFSSDNKLTIQFLVNSRECMYH